MNWQEYQNAVGELYLQLEGIGTVQKNITLPDKITGHARQIDVWMEVETKSHKLGVLIDAKYRKDKLDVKDVEEVLSLVEAVGAHMGVLVALSGWTQPAEVKAKSTGVDLRLFSLEEALNLMEPGKWIVCPVCENDCILMDIDGGMVIDGMWSLLTAGRCRECRAALAWCWACGEHVLIQKGQKAICACKHTWKDKGVDLLVKPYRSNKWILIINDTEIHIQRGSTYREQGKAEQAVAEFSKLIAQAPKSAIAYYHRALTYDFFGNQNEAIQDYTRSIELDSTYAMSYGSRGIVYFASGQLQSALLDFQQYLTLNPDGPDVELIRAVVQEIESDLESQVE